MIFRGVAAARGRFDSDPDWGGEARARLTMHRSGNLSPWHRPPKPSLDNGPIQRRVRRAFIGSGFAVMSTTQIAAPTVPAAIRRTVSSFRPWTGRTQYALGKHELQGDD